MSKRFKKLGIGLALTASMMMLGGCGNKVKVSDIVDKYYGMCELGEYKNIEYVETKTEITDDMVQNEVNSMLSKYATSETLTSGTAENGDTVSINYVGTLVGKKDSFDTGENYSLKLGSNTMIDGFEEQIVGHDVGETFDIVATFPDEYSANPDLAGKPATFEITINSITRQTLPEYTDAFVASNTDADSIEDYEKSVREDLVNQYAESDDKYNKSAIMQIVVNNASITRYPEQEMEELVDETIDRVQKEADQYGYDLATYVSARYGYDEEAFRNYVSGLVEDYMKEKIVVCAIAKAEGITVSKDEIKAYKAEMLTSSGLTSEADFDKYYTDEDVAYYTLAEKVVDFLLDNGVPTVATDTDAESEDASSTDATSGDAE